MTEVAIKAELLLTLESKQDWINKVPRRLPPKNRYGEQFLCVDSNGYVLEIGADFAAAERLKSYPVRFYRKITVSQFEEGGDNGSDQ